MHIQQAVRRVPFAAEQEIANQLTKMQQMGVIKPTESLLSGISEKERWNTLRFCVDYWSLNSIICIHCREKLTS